MLTPDSIEEIRHHTGVSAIAAMHALTLAEGDIQRAINSLNDHSRSGHRAIIATTKESAQRIAAALVDAGVWFECELDAEAHWRFCVALGAYSRLVALSATANSEAQAA